MEGPLSLHSCLEIQICWKVESEARMEPPIQTEYLRLGGSDDLNCRIRRGEGHHCLLQASGEALEPSSAARDDDVVLADVNVALHDGLKQGVADSLPMNIGWKVTTWPTRIFRSRLQRPQVPSTLELNEPPTHVGRAARGGDQSVQ